MRGVAREPSPALHHRLGTLGKRAAPVLRSLLLRRDDIDR
jgi:hypothetical protein